MMRRLILPITNSQSVVPVIIEPTPPINPIYQNSQVCRMSGRPGPCLGSMVSKVKVIKTITNIINHHQDQSSFAPSLILSPSYSPQLKSHYRLIDFQLGHPHHQIQINLLTKVSFYSKVKEPKFKQQQCQHSRNEAKRYIYCMRLSHKSQVII